MTQHEPMNIAGSEGADAVCAGLVPSVRSQALRLGAMGGLALCWIALDQAVKFRLNAHAAGSVLSDPVAGLFRLHLVHNTGGAWSMFSGATAALGVFSVLMCAALAAFAVHERARISWPELIGLGLVIGGGVGNAIDRFVLGYVVDFIDLSFMDFPVFNIADIGVTCGLVLFLIGWIVRERHHEEVR
ncbi:signal peptidase II [Senegalimassilia anaerobia]|uniref:signal peptidase II n=1 Tax=Senegalimassilia anaerobia TaxID=1473216 RepID=UPI0026F1BBCA|nr:signal peptidase II [Senegalimassilia anaerobia]